MAGVDVTVTCDTKDISCENIPVVWSSWSPCSSTCGPGSQNRSSNYDDLEVRDCDGACGASEIILVTSNGDAADNQGYMMGLYKLMSRRYNNGPAYRQLHNITGHCSGNSIEFSCILDPFLCAILTLNEPANLK